ncbi:MAG: gluconokinase, partial [Bacteroidota bacterium]|nr:gluconokinase [Bacteroidota bacterium]
MEPYIIGVDIGTGSAKAVALKYSGEIIASSQRNYNLLETASDFSEQDPEIIWNAFVACLKETVNAANSVPVAVSFSSAMHSVLVIDKNNKPITNVITWADTRSEKIAEEIRTSAIAETLYRETGTPIHSMSPLCKIIWFKKKSTEIFAGAFKFISIKEFIWYRLFNEYEIDKSLASATGLYNILTGVWNKRSLDLCGITASHLSTIVPTDFARKNINKQIGEELNITSNTSFCIGASDGCLANIGSYALERGTAAITIGTSGAVRIAAHEPVFDFKAMIFNYVLDEDTFICGGPVNNGGNILNWMMHSFLKIANPADSEYNTFFKEVAEAPAGSKGLLFLPYLFGERAPIWDEKSAGIFFGIKSFHNQSHFLRASMEGVCYGLKNILAIIEESKGTIEQLNVSGGFIHSKVWVQILSDVTGKEICLVQTDDASAIGAAMLYMKSVNIIEKYSSLQHGERSTVLPIDGNHLVYEKYYPV